MVGMTELIVIAVIVTLIFGATAIPKIAKSIGKAKGEFDKGVKETKDSE